MNDISQSKILRPWTWIGRRKKPPIVLPPENGRRKKPPIVLPPETLTNILHYFPRKQLVERFCPVNSSFFNVANRLLPNVHVINFRNIQFCFTHQTSHSTGPNANPEPFKGIILSQYISYKDRNRRSKIEILLCVRPKRDRRDRIKIRISAEEFLENMPPAFIRFPEFYIISCPDEVLLKFLRDSKHHFENCHLYFEILNHDDKHLQKVEELLSDTFLNPSAISFGDPSFASEKIFNTTGARNSDKLELSIRNASTCTKDTLLEWIQWKQNQSGSRRHLVLKCSLHSVASQELLDVLKHAFETATKPLSYVITFAETDYGNRNPGEFHLDNDHTRERLSLFRDKRYCYRLWRRTVTSSDSTWLMALINGTWMEKEVREAARKTGFDEKFYDYYLHQPREFIFA
ncbi:hypothetical protein Ddc_14011 [Ditylenchus destructor]|nr:hypothetical protein Ddc_14011 [Ditylenchus destructor]